MRIEAVPPSEVERIRAQIVRTYRRAWLPTRFRSEERTVSGFEGHFDTHRTREGFRLLIARDDTEFQGFVYGYTSRPGTWWHDLVARSLDDQERERWLADCFEFVELAVVPESQGRGIGAALHDAILEDATQRTSALSTYQEQEAAVNLYRSRGWVTLIEGFMFPGDRFPYLVMGRELKSP